MLWTLLATTFIWTNPSAGEKCDYIEIVKGEPFLEVHYVNSANECSWNGSWELTLDGVSVEVSVTLMGQDDFREKVEVKVLDNLPYTVEPSDVQFASDTNEKVIFTLIPMMF